MKLVKQKYGSRLIYNQNSVIQLKQLLENKQITLNCRKSKFLGTYQLALHYKYPFYVYNNYIHASLKILRYLFGYYIFENELEPQRYSNNFYRIPLPTTQKLSLHEQYKIAKGLIHG